MRFTTRVITYFSIPCPAKSFSFVMLVSALLVGTGQLPARAQHRPPVFAQLRYREDYAYLGKDSLFAARTAWEKLKFAPLNSRRSAYLTIGGEVREQYELIKNYNWGKGPEDGNGYLLQRYLLHADLHLSPRVRVFGQLQSGLATGKAGGPDLPDEDRLDLHQAFADLRLATSPGQTLTLRVGRQELDYGASWLISTREGPTVRQSFDALKVFYQRPGHQVDAFVSRPVRTNRYAFDNEADPTKALWGLYSVHQLPQLPRASLDLYYLGLHQERARFQDGAGRERRHTVGARLWNAGSPFTYNLEGIYQFGTLAGQRISAYTVSAKAGYAWATAPRWQPFAELKAEIVSGDQRPGDNRLDTFNPLFPRRVYFSQIALIGPANLVNARPLVGMRPLPALRLSVEADLFWRQSRADGFYTTPYVLTRAGNESQARHIGDQYTLRVEWTVNAFVVLEGYATYFAAGAFLRESGAGREITFFAPRITMRF